MLGDRHEAEDVVQALFLDLIRKGRMDVDFGYLYRAATTRSLNRIRDRRRRAELLEQHGDPLVLHPPGSPEGQVVSRQVLARFFAQLDRRSAEIVAYHYIDGMTQAEIADLLGVSRRAVVKRLSRMRDQLRDLLPEEAP